MFFTLINKICFCKIFIKSATGFCNNLIKVKTGFCNNLIKAKTGFCNNLIKAKTGIYKKIYFKTGFCNNLIKVNTCIYKKIYSKTGFCNNLIKDKTGIYKKIYSKLSFSNIYIKGKIGLLNNLKKFYFKIKIYNFSIHFSLIITKINNKKIYLGYLLFLLIINCINFVKPDNFEKVKLDSFSDTDNLLDKIYNYNFPRGVLPASLYTKVLNKNFNNDFVYLNSDFTNEFFIFDDNHILVFLDYKNLFYLEIESKLFKDHFNSEFNQIKNNKFGTSKNITSTPFLKNLNNLSVEIYFGPQEIGFGKNGENSFRIYQSGNLPPRPDLWRLIEAANFSESYFNEFIDIQFLNDLKEHISKGKKRFLYLNKFNLDEELPNFAGYTHEIPFTFFYGENLVVDKILLDGENPNYTDLNELTKDFLFITNINIGSALNNLSNKKQSNYLDYKNSISVLFRGKVDKLYKKILEFTSKKIEINISTSPPPPPYYKKVIFAQIGNNINNDTKNDYIVLYNPNAVSISLGGLYFGRDSNCDLSNGWTDYISLSSEIILPYSYFLLTNNQSEILIGDYEFNLSFSSNHCLIISHSEIPPLTLDDPNIIEKVTLPNLGVGDILNRKGKCKSLLESQYAANLNSNKDFDDNSITRNISSLINTSTLSQIAETQVTPETPETPVTQVTPETNKDINNNNPITDNNDTTTFFEKIYPIFFSPPLNSKSPSCNLFN